MTTSTEKPRQVCMEHSGIEKEISNVKEIMSGLAQDLRDVFGKIDGAKNWLIGGLLTIVLNLVGTIATIALLYVQLKKE